MIRCRRATCVLLALLLLETACGKKGPPLAPLRPIPAVVADVTGRRAGQEVHIQFTVPSLNQGLTGPADLERIEVYGVTAIGSAASPPSLTEEMLREVATLVASVEIRPPPAPPLPPSGETPAPEVPEAPPPVDTRPGQGESITVVEVLTPESKVPVDLVPSKRRREDRERSTGKMALINRPLLSPVLDPAPLPRTYVVVGVSRYGQRGNPSTPIQVSLVDSPPPPPTPDLSYNERSVVTIAWSRPRGARRAQETAVAPVLAGRIVGAWPESLRYNLYEVTAGGGVPVVASTPLNRAPVESAPLMIRHVLVPPGPAGAVTVAGPMPAPTGVAAPLFVPTGVPTLDALRIAAMTVSLFAPTGLPAPGAFARTAGDPRIALGAERCYALRSVATEHGLEVESEPSLPACITLHDVYPPAPPQGLSAVGGEGSVSLIWNPNQEPDLAGYLVLRAEAPGETLQRLTPEPIRATSYVDTEVQVGVRYVYAIVAVDSTTPPNASAESDRIEESAR